VESKASREIRSFEDLDAWKLGFEIAKKIYALTESFPATERYNLTSQLRRSASSIPANIAEGFGRHTPKDYLQFLIYARGSIAETQSHIRLSFELKLLENDDEKAIIALCERARQTLQGLIRYVRSKTALSYDNLISEGLIEYNANVLGNNELHDTIDDL
jgi:four helix bundle protein